MKKEKRYSVVGCFGFAGFLGFTYFLSHNAQSLFWFSFFAFFCYFPLGKLLAETPDERYIANSCRAKLKTAIIPLAAVFIIGFASGYPFVSREAIIVFCALSWSATLLLYALLLIHYERH